ncbi:MAG: DNA mismatch repair protein MutS [Lachnospiraceae bacterium]|nr:DNA mismatch repair protein MutS [Lachnospiraceae bacterium]
MMRLYIETRRAYPDCILFYRLGDFYEMFFDDALTVSRELELTLTGKACGLAQRAPMCGVPYHAAENYLTRLVAKGYKVAVCDQTEDPKLAKGLVKREVTRIVTPGTNLNIQALDETRNNYLCCICMQPDVTGIAIADISTGEFQVTETRDLKETTDELFRFMPSEIIANDAFFISGADITQWKEQYGIAVYRLEDRLFDADLCRNTLYQQFHVRSLSTLGLDVFPTAYRAAGALLQYLKKMQLVKLHNLTRINPYAAGQYMLLDAASRRNLELTETLRDKTKRGTLFWVLDKTGTAMGARKLRAWIEQPLTKRYEIQLRLDAAEALYTHVITRDEIREYLKPVYDLERLMARISYRSAHPKDLLAFGQSLQMLAPLRIALSELTDESPLLSQLYEEIDPLSDLCDLCLGAIDEEAPLSVREGGIIKQGFDEEIDRLREADINGKRWLLELEEETRNRSGIRTLRIKYNNNFGYCFEVSNSFKDKVPEDFIRRQTLTNAERYTTEKLKALEDTILGARDRRNALEYERFCEVRDKIASEIERVRKTADAVATLDVLTSFARCAEQYRYVKPVLSEDARIRILEGRHPVVERMQEEKEQFVANDTLLDCRENRCLIITGPNMAGKSTYLRQTALIVLMAQIGSFVPAAEADIGIADRIFTRVGASDDLASGRSTFMVEMSEVANILRNATNRSLLILDEIGRGTSTTDGLAIARAVVEYIADEKILGARTLFATHYHELTSLEGRLPGVRNLCSTVKENPDGVVFLRRIAYGGADESYGIQVARIAGVPEAVIERAMQIARLLQKNAPDTESEKTKPQAEEAMEQLSFFLPPGEDAVLAQIRGTDINELTPMQALNLLSAWQEELGQRE